MRWSEEVDLLEEEMRRVAQFFTWQAGWWEEQVGTRGLPDGPQAEGETAYALRQSRLKAKLCAKFTDSWKALPMLIEAGREACRAGRNPGDSNSESTGPLDEEDEEGVHSDGEDEEPVPQVALQPVQASLGDLD
jgi:hypothetical protein